MLSTCPKVCYDYDQCRIKLAGPLAIFVEKKLFNWKKHIFLREKAFFQIRNGDFHLSRRRTYI